MSHRSTNSSIKLLIIIAIFKRIKICIPNLNVPNKTTRIIISLTSLHWRSTFSAQRWPFVEKKKKKRLFFYFIYLFSGPVLFFISIPVGGWHFNKHHPQTKTELIELCCTLNLLSWQDSEPTFSSHIKELKFRQSLKLLKGYFQNDRSSIVL